MLTYEDPPDENDATVPTREDIGRELFANAGKWAIVARHDRAERAIAHAQRIVEGREYGPLFDAVNRRVGNEHRVYARRDALTVHDVLPS